MSDNDPNSPRRNCSRLGCFAIRRTKVVQHRLVPRSAVADLTIAPLLTVRVEEVRVRQVVSLVAEMMPMMIMKMVL